VTSESGPAAVLLRPLAGGTHPNETGGTYEPVLDGGRLLCRFTIPFVTLVDMVFVVEFMECQAS
jgi:hypothetical protein